MRGGVVEGIELDSGLAEDVVSVLLLAEAEVRVVAFEAVVEGVAEDVIAEDEDDGVAVVVSVVVLVEIACVLVVVTGGDVFVFVGATTYDVPNPNK